ncbi:MAG TPA: transcription-repair coupling factor [Planctomycetes bacterium]|nr:transcription-repair coupling factor [Planctomycetota bacterium]
MTVNAASDPVLAAGTLQGHAPFEDLLIRLEAREAVHAGGLWGSSQALVVAELSRRAQGPWLVVTSSETEAELFIDDLASFGADALALPAREPMASSSRSDSDHMHADPETIRRRLKVAQVFSAPPERRPRVLVASLLSLLQPIPSPKDLERDFVGLAVHQNLDVEELLERLVAAGYTRQPLAEAPGEVSLRGDILDVFTFAADEPLRIELFDEEIESLRTFDPETQRSTEDLTQVSLCIASDTGGVEDGRGLQIVSLLSPTTTHIEVEPLRIEDQAEGLRIRSSAHAKALLHLRESVADWRHLALQSLPGKTLDFDTRSVQSLAVGMRAAKKAVRDEAQGGARVLCICTNEGEEKRLGELIGPGPVGDGAIETAVGSLSKGFRMRGLDGGELVLVHHRELAGIGGAVRRRAKRKTHRVRALESFFELAPGDLVVHAVHGLARFVGLERIERAGGEEEHLHLRFADDVSLYVPAPRIDLVQRYVGSGSASPELDRIGSSSFKKRKEKVERALMDLASDLLEVQAKRELRRRPPWNGDPELVRELIEAFPYADTPDQAEADREIARDLASPRPMDRLLCGDVGFGKTEVAIRAAFRVVSGGAQVAVLVPTTVLAHQHAQTFRERLADFPVEVAALSRYVTGKRAREVIERVESGSVDILIGTHRILSKDVRFQKLGLVIVDEEQRFGVTHKEHFKKLRAELDLLTLTATPIPRTLHLSLSGLRDISALSTPPEGRQEIETRLAPKGDTDRLRRALLREKMRGGQVFFLHNRVHSIEVRARELMEIAPECTFAIGHGQMSGRDLRAVMDEFQRGHVDVLVATTIVENGVDIPTAGTILIDDADHFGLAELHQLRGRVGRGDRRSYCYLLVDPTKPMRDVARERLKAIEELTQLGAGFQISMKDLEIRGAGNILGPQQSGHISAIGYDMYCRLLHQTVERLRGAEGDAGEPEAMWAQIPAEVTRELEDAAVEIELGISAYLPENWIESPTERLEVLRELAHIDSAAGADEVLAALRDRFGRVPAEAEALVRVFELRSLSAAIGLRRLAWRGDTYLIEYRDRVALETALAGKELELRPLAAGRALLVIPGGRKDPADAARWIHELLRGSPGEPRIPARPGSRC